MESSIWDKRRESLRAELKSARKVVGLTQAEVAARLNVPQSFVSKYESGERRLDFIEVIEVCEALGLPWVELAKSVLREP